MSDPDSARSLPAAVALAAPDGVGLAAVDSERRLHLLLASTNFAQGLGAFVVIGLIGAVGVGLQVGMQHAGWMVSLYALVYAVSSPLLVSGFGRVDRRTMLSTGLLLLTTGALLASLAPNFSTLLAARAAMAVGGGLITPVAAAIGLATSTPAHRGRALATVFGGLTLAQALGVPTGAWLGSFVGWRATFGFVSLISLAVLVLVMFKVPRGIRVQSTSLATLGAVLRVPRLMMAVAFIVFFIGCNFSLLTYLTPFLVSRHQLDGAQIAFVLMIYGVAAVVGNKVGGRLTDSLGAVRTLVLLCCIQIVVLPAITMFDLPLSMRIALILVWSVFGWSVHVPQQARLAQADPPRAPVLLALHSAAIYVGSSLGSASAGHVLADADNFQWIGPVGAAFSACSLLSLGVVSWMSRRGT